VLFFPTRLDQYKIGPLDDILIKNAIIKISKNKMTSEEEAKAIAG
jgi:hypothetical protein